MVNELVLKLSKGKHEVTIGERDETIEKLKQRVEEYKYIHIKFIKTKGGTDLGINIDNTKTDISEISSKNGKIHIEGTTTLNYENVRCIADIDISTKKGYGCLKLEDKTTENNTIN